MDVWEMCEGDYSAPLRLQSLVIIDTSISLLFSKLQEYVIQRFDCIIL